MNNFDAPRVFFLQKSSCQNPLLICPPKFPPKQPRYGTNNIMIDDELSWLFWLVGARITTPHRTTLSNRICHYRGPWLVGGMTIN
jgi:hypothetical protein